jgi:hypothetical protein
MTIDIPILFLSLCCAFTWVEKIRLWRLIKPFNCIPCLTGWFALIFACCEYGWGGILYGPMGVFVGAMYGGIKMRWL